MANPKDAMNRLKFEIASQVGVSLKDGYNGDLTSSQAGKVGGNIVKKLVNDAKNTLK